MISVLFVDDDKNVRDLGKMFLESNGDITVERVSSAQKGLELLDTRQYDAIISDYQMPKMDGIEFLNEVRTRHGQIPFILFTGKGREEVAILALNSGADFYLQKGIDSASQFAELRNQVIKAVREYRAVMAVHEYEQKMVDLIEFLPDATFAIDHHGVVIAWNRAIEEMTGVSADQMIGKGDYQYAIPFYGSRRPMMIDLISAPLHTFSDLYSNVTQTGTMLAAETALPNMKGVRKTLWGKASPLYNRQGEIVGAIESIRDISEWKKLEEELKKSEERYRTLAESSHDLIYIIDRDDIIVYINSFAARALNRRKEEIIGINRSFFFPDSDRNTQLESIRKVFASGVPFRIESRVSFPDHDTWQDTLLTPLKNDDGEVVEVMGVTRDLTSRYNAEKELQKAHEELKQNVAEKAEELHRLYLELIRKPEA